MHGAKLKETLTPDDMESVTSVETAVQELGEDSDEWWQGTNKSGQEELGPDSVISKLVLCGASWKHFGFQSRARVITHHRVEPSKRCETEAGSKTSASV